MLKAHSLCFYHMMTSCQETMRNAKPRTNLWTLIRFLIPRSFTLSQFLTSILFLSCACFLILRVIYFAVWSLKREYNLGASSDTLLSSSERPLDRWRRQSALASFVLWQVRSIPLTHACVCLSNSRAPPCECLSNSRAPPSALDLHFRILLFES